MGRSWDRGDLISPKGTQAEGLFLKMLLSRGIEAEHGSPSRPGDIIVLPNIIIEIKDLKEKSFSFKQHSGKGANQWKVLRQKLERHPWLEVYYVIRFERAHWRYFSFPDNTVPLHKLDGHEIQELLSILKEKQEHFAMSSGVDAV